ncbi:MAG TPA: MmcQ/YjbR family DNA-binding protein [Rhodanobacter sp.]|nr:MmcQ/YjbR family DNA-binding protein [Rhodanobacter sp.]
MVTLARFRELALRLPLAEELDHFGTPSFRVRGKIFAQFSRGSDDAIFKFLLDELDVLRMSASDLFEPDPGWGKHGWTHVRIAEMDEAWVDQLLRDAWRRVTPKKLHGELDGSA